MNLDEAKTFIAGGYPTDNVSDIMLFHILSERIHRAENGKIGACPFCGDDMGSSVKNHSAGYAVECGCCGGRGSVVASKEDAIFRWNEITSGRKDR